MQPTGRACETLSADYQHADFGKPNRQSNDSPAGGCMVLVVRRSFEPLTSELTYRCLFALVSLSLVIPQAANYNGYLLRRPSVRPFLSSTCYSIRQTSLPFKLLGNQSTNSPFKPLYVPFPGDHQRIMQPSGRVWWLLISQLSAG